MKKIFKLANSFKKTSQEKGQMSDLALSAAIRNLITDIHKRYKIDNLEFKGEGWLSTEREIDNITKKMNFYIKPFYYYKFKHEGGISWHTISSRIYSAVPSSITESSIPGIGRKLDFWTVLNKARMNRVK
jgi:hypothetical protein